jgi:membrane-associated phospholipid phosphatase
MRRILLAAIPTCVLLARRRRQLGLPRGISLPLTASVPLSVAAVAPPGRPRTVAVWSAFMWSYKVAFETPYDQPPSLRRRLRIDEPIRADRRLLGGETPAARWQRRLRNPPRINSLDRAAALFYSTWEAEPHLALSWLLWRHPELFPTAALRVGSAFAGSLVGYYLFPTAPPWWASEREGRLDRSVRRVTMEVAKELRGKPRPGSDHNSGSNPWASMPSDHFGSAVATAAVLARADWRAGALGAAYAALLGATLLYTGEHYFVDLLGGLGLAGTAYAAGGPLSEPARRLGEALAAG